jgi:dihydroneopterin aldolase
MRVSADPLLRWPTEDRRNVTAPIPLDVVFIEGLTGSTVIGIHDSELHTAQPVRIDLWAGMARTRACDTDLIADTIDYAAVRLRLRRLLQEHRVRLLEAFAELIARTLVQEFSAKWVRVVVSKPAKFDDVSSVGVAIERRAEDFGRGPPGDRPAAVLSLLGAGTVPR